ncbi:hypothetical protein Trydic_g21753 [Trypoxylus dichotomus]
MTEEVYNRKLSDLQKHIPFMENMITQLKDPKWKPREAQLNKMESLYSMITDRNKKWKYETLLKCEEVILKLQSKVKANRPIFQAEKKEQFMNPERPEPLSNAVSDIMNALKFSNARAKLNSEIMSTPKSPSPIKEVLPQHAPKIIPFEATNEPIRKSTNIIDPNELSVTWNNDRQDRLGPVVPEVTEKPLLSDADLEMLRAGDDFLVICHNDRQNQSETKEKPSIADISLKIPPRIAPVPASKPKLGLNENSSSPGKEEKLAKHAKKIEGSKEEVRVKNKDSSSKNKSSKSEKVATSDIFGSCLSSIDNMILEDSKKKDKKKEDRRHSGEHKKEHGSKHGHESKHHRHHKHKSKDKDKHKEKIKDAEHRSKKEDVKERKCDDKKLTKEDAGPVTLEKMAEKIMENKERLPEASLTSPVTEKEVEKPKRLADKYNPKPRKHSEIEVSLPLEKIQNESGTFEIRDPRRRPTALLPTPTSLLGPPPFQPPALPNLALPISANIPTTPNIPLVPPFIPRTVQQPTISPTQVLPLMQLNVPPQDFPPPSTLQPWLNDGQDFQRPAQNTVFEPPPKFVDPRRGAFHQDGVPERLSTDPRRQPRFSPPPTISPVHTTQFGSGFGSNIYANNLNFVPPIQRGIFEPPSTVQQGRFEPPSGSRFDSPLPNNHGNQSNVPRKNFCPFEPLESSRDKEEGHHNQGFFQKGHGYRGGFGQYNNNRFDRYGKKPLRDDGKMLQRQDSFNKDKFKPPFKEEIPKDRSVKLEEDVKSRFGGENDQNQKELSHTKYDEIYSKLDVEKETFSSPLESLYSNAKTSVKSIQSFKIPKKPKPEVSVSSTVIDEPKKEVKIKTESEKESPKASQFKSKDKASTKSLPDEFDQSLNEPEDKEVEKIESKVSNASEDLSGNESDDVPIGKRIRRRTKIINKKKVIDDSDDDSILGEESGKVSEEDEQEEEDTSRPKRSTRQSAIKANKLIRKRSTITKAKKRVTRTRIREVADKTEEKPSENYEKPKAECKEADSTIKDENLSKEEPPNEAKKEEKETKEVEEIKTDDKEVEINADDSTATEEKLIIEKQPDEVQKAKEELITEAKKKNLNLNDQGAEVLQFILMNYKKIKKIFRSDNSSDEEEKTKKKKKKKREKSSDDDSDKSEKDEKKFKEKKVSEVENDEDKCVAEEKSKVEKKETKENESELETETNQEAKKESPEEDDDDEEEIPASEPIDPKPKVVAKQSGKKVKRVGARKGKLVRRKLQGRITRNKALHSPVKKARRSELDKLHDDIKEMLMGGEVLTSTGKRSCTIPKDDVDETKKSETAEEQPIPSLPEQNIPIIPARGTHLRVIIEKTDIEKLLTKENIKDSADDTSQDLGEPPKLEKMVASPPTKVAKKRMLRKKKHRWASGLLRKKNKRATISISDDKDESPSISIVKTENTKDAFHTKDYYVDGAKNQCKLCSFKGKLIIQHYKSNHPQSEILISRMDPKTTEHLIRESRAMRYDLIELQETVNTKKLRFSFKCPFKCLMGTTVEPFDSYYDHITSHTGEHRYFCPFCNFSTFNSRNLRAHMVPQHSSNLEHHGKPTTPTPPSSKYMFGFVCKQCHYVQTKRDKLESHVKEYHGNDAEIVKVNLSLTPRGQDETGLILEASGDDNLVLQSQKKQGHINECIENVVNGAGMIRSPEPSLVKDLNIFELMSQIETEEPPPVLVKVEPLELEPDLDALVPEIQLEESRIERPKDPDLTVFMCRSDLPIDDEETIEQRRLKKMNEIHESFKPSRTSIVDKLQRMLETASEDDHRNPTPPISSSPVFSRPSSSVPTERSKKSLDSIAKNLVTAEVSLSPKNVAPIISSIINRLHDKLLSIPGTSSKDIGGADSLPSSVTSSPARESVTSAEQSVSNSSLSIGPITIAFNKKKEVVYSCFIPFCVFNTVKAQLFEVHCKTMHKDFVHNQARCDACNVKIDHEDSFISLHDLYRHVCTCHKDFLESLPSIEGPSQGNLHEIEGESGTLYPYADVDNVEGAHQQNTAPENEDDSKKKYAFVIRNITSVEQPVVTKEPEVQKRMTFSLPHKVPNVISQANNRKGPKFPFIITNVTSLAKKFPPTKAQFTTTPTTVPQTSTNTVISSTPAILNITPGEVVSTTTLVPIAPITSVIAIQSVSGIQTSPAIKPYTIPSISTTPSIIPIILNPLAPENEKSKVQLPIISSVQSLAPVRKDIIRPVPLDQLKSTFGNDLELPESANKGVPFVNSDVTTVTLKDIPLSSQECYAPRKYKGALQDMLSPEHIVHFYKCPQYACSFTSDNATDFSKHLASHTKETGKHIPCLYCDFKVPFKKYLIHLELRHSNCDYGCGKCLYRATNAGFVVAHNRVKHKDEPVVIKTPRENMPARIPTRNLLPIKSILKPYVCAHTGCNMETIFFDVFVYHVNTEHPSTSKILANIAYCSLSGLHMYHCRYCTMGSNNIEMVVNHQAATHSAMDYCVIQRKFVPNPNFPEKTALSYSLEDDSIYDRLYFIYGDNGATPASSAASSTSSNANSTDSVSSNDQNDDRTDPLFLDLDQIENNDTTVENAFDPLLNDVNMLDCSAAASTDEPEISILNSDLDEAITDPLSFDVRESIDNNFSDGFDSNDERGGEGEVAAGYDPKAVKHTEEFMGVDLFKCVCGLGFENRFKFKHHVVACQAGKEFKCAHCGLVRNSVRNLLTHLNEHGRKRFKCSLCQYKHSSKRFVKDHMNIEHNVHEMMVLPAAISKKIDYQKDDFVLRPKLSPVKRLSNASSIPDSPGAAKSIFSPNEIEQLPRPPIYQTDVFCAVCNYATKVKSNMVRHLQAHQNEQAVPRTAPVNPVPCLEKSEKMFDKMVNLALSSHSGGRMGGNGPKIEKIENNVPTFVPVNKRFVCGAQSCTYLCPEEGMLRRHLTTFHSQELNYTCLHCNSNLFDEKMINVDTILKHLKLHDNHLYSCGHCKFIHNLKHKVERHLSDKHADKPPAFIVIREMGKEVDAEGGVIVEKEELKKAWRCGMCKFRCVDIEEVKNHTQVKHNVTAKQKCGLCEFGSEELGSLVRHFEADHNGQDVDVIVSYYKEDEMHQKPDTDSEFNTTPLWQRNKSVKHIRGILLDDTHNKGSKATGPKKAKTWKLKKQENELAKTSKTTDATQDVKKDTPPTLEISKKAFSAVKKDATPTETSKRHAPAIFDIPSGSSKDIDVKKPAPKRRRSRLESKVAASPKADEVKPKITESTVDNDVILINNSDEDVINVDDIPDTEKKEGEKPKQTIIVLSDHKLSVNPDKIDKPNKESISKVVAISRKCTDAVQSEKPPNMTVMPKIVNITSGTSAIIEIADERPEDVQIIEDVPSKEAGISDNSVDLVEISNDDKKTEKEQRPLQSVTITKIPVLPAEILDDYPQITLEDSSTEDSDVVEVVAGSSNQTSSEGVAEDPATNLESEEAISAPGLKNVKLVNVCSVRDTYKEDSDDEMNDEGVGEVRNHELTENADETPQKKSKLDLTLCDIEAMTQTELLNGNFVGTYGPYGFPWSGSYKCPLCEKYLTASKANFVAHIYEELQYGMYKCTACGFTDSDKATVKDHHKLTHKDIKTKERVLLNLDQQIIDWVDKLTVFQTRILTLDKEESQEMYFYCYFCEYKCAAQSDMRKHLVRHWTTPPYTCAICQYKGIQRSVVVKHISRCHPKMAVQINELEVGEEVVIKRIRMTWRSGKNTDGPKCYDTLETECDADFNLEDLKDAFLNCGYCTAREKLEALKTHCAEKHPDLVLKAFRYRCNYCASTFLAQQSVEQHFKTCHEGMRHSYSTACDAQRLYTCSECSVSEDKLVTIEEHLRSHFKMIKCLYCGLKTVYWKTMKKHHNDKHRGENYEFAYLICEEKKYEEALAKVKQTNNSITVNSRKRKRIEEHSPVPEDDTIVKGKVRQVARKSTGTSRKIKEPESGYGKKPSIEEFANVVTNFDMVGTPVTMNIVDLSKFLNISPSVTLQDCKNTL